MTLPKVITVAGSDSSGGAGIQADLKTFQELGVYGMSALTVIVAMDPDARWSHRVFPLPLETVEAQLDTILKGIGVQALKTGMLGSVELVDLIAQYIQRYQVHNVVIDPVMVCKGTDEVLNIEPVERLKEVLLPLATVVTPNLFEAGQLSGLGTLDCEEAMQQAAKRIHDQGVRNVLIKGGGRLAGDQASDLLYDGKEFHWFRVPKCDTTYMHGAGCTYSAAVTAYLSKGYSVFEAVAEAKKFVTTAICNGFPLNKFVGPLNHGAWRRGKTK